MTTNNVYKKLLWLLLLFSTNQITAQKRIEEYKELDSLIIHHDTQNVSAKVKVLMEDDDWSSIPFYQMAQIFYKQLGTVSLYDSSTQNSLGDSIQKYTSFALDKVVEKKALRKDDKYWISVLPSLIDMDTVVVKKLFQDLIASKSNYLEQTAQLRQRLYTIKNTYRNAEKDFIAITHAYEDPKLLYLTASTAQEDTLNAIIKLAKQLRSNISDYEAYYQEHPFPPYFKQSFEWEIPYPNGRNHHRIIAGGFVDKEILLSDFEVWGDSILKEIERCRQLGTTAIEYYQLWSSFDTWDKQKIATAEKQLTDLISSLNKYGTTYGLECVLSLLIDQGKYQQSKHDFYQLDKEIFIHKSLRDKYLEDLSSILVQLNNKAYNIKKGAHNYAYQYKFIQSLGAGDEPMNTIRDRINSFVTTEQLKLSVARGFQLLPSDFPNMFTYNGKELWLRPALKPIDSLYESGAYITQSVFPYNSSALFVEGKYEFTGKEAAFLAYVRKEEGVKWVQSFTNSSNITADRNSLDGDKLLFYRFAGTDSLYLEVVDTIGQQQFQTPIPSIPHEKHIADKTNTIWLIWLDTLRDASGYQNGHFQELNYTDGSIVDADSFLLKGNISAIRPHDKGIHIVGNFTEIIDWEGKYHRSSANAGSATNAFILSVFPAKIRSTIPILSNSPLHVNQVFFDPTMGVIRLLGYSGDFEYSPDGKVTGGQQWQEYIEP